MLTEQKNFLTSFLNVSLTSSEERFRQMLKGPDGATMPHRMVYDEVRTLIDDFRQGGRGIRWVVMPGLRGMGKTTMLGQTYLHLITNGVPRERVLYASLDALHTNVGSSLSDLMEIYEERLGMFLEQVPRERPVFLLFDEVHYEPQWDAVLKVIYDRTPNVFLIATGSSALSLSLGADSARRSFVVKVPPVSFSEFLQMKGRARSGVEDEIWNALMRSENAGEVHRKLLGLRPALANILTSVNPFMVDDFLRTGSIAQSVFVNERYRALAMIYAMIERVVMLDMPVELDLKSYTQIKTMALLSRLAISDRTTLESLSRDLEMSKPTLIVLLDYLEKAGVISKVRPYGSQATMARKTPKYMFACPALRASLLDRTGMGVESGEWMGRLLEDAVSGYLDRQPEHRPRPMVNYDQNEGGADFIVTYPVDRPIVIEVGYGKKDLGQIDLTSSRVHPKYSLLVNDGPLELIDDRIVRLPREWFLLSR